MTAVIRQIEPRDLPALVGLCKEHAAYERSEFCDNGQLERLPGAFFGLPPKLHGWVVESGNQLVGFMTVTVDFATWTADHFLHMDCLYLKEEFRRKGLGRRLIAELKKFGQNQNISLIQWQTPTHNIDGIRFYEEMGAYSKDKKRYFLTVES
jgi:ribosomal protein S18 acetylase RimI-like enzyme